MIHSIYSKGVAYSVSDIIQRIDKKLYIDAATLMNVLQYDLKPVVDVVELHLLITYKNALIAKLTSCRDCFSEHSKYEISSKILKIIY